MLQARTPFLWLIWLGILLPLTLEGTWKIPVGPYDLRAHYLFFLLMIGEGFYSYPKEVLRYALRPSLRWLWAAALIGLIGVLFISTYPSRAIAYWIWAIGTAFALPCFLPRLVERLGKKSISALSLLCITLALIVLWDFVTCKMRLYSWSIGYVNAPWFCRPHAFFQEPTYLAGFLLAAAVTLRKFRSWYGYAACLLAIFVSGSRLGWIGAIALMALEIIFILKHPIKQRAKHLTWLVLILFLVLPIAGVTLFTYTFQTVTRPWDFFTELSSSQRLHVAQASLDIVFKSPLFGVGPGSSGAYFIDKMPRSHPYRVFRETELGNLNAFDLQRKDAFSNDLFTELFAEWGILGALAWFFFILGLFRQGALQKNEIWFPMVAFGTLYLSNPTLARADLWVCIALLSMRPNH